MYSRNYHLKFHHVNAINIHNTFNAILSNSNEDILVDSQASGRGYYLMEKVDDTIKLTEIDTE